MARKLPSVKKRNKSMAFLYATILMALGIYLFFISIDFIIGCGPIFSINCFIALIVITLSLFALTYSIILVSE